MKPPKSRKAELGPNASGGEKSHAETAESAEFKMTELGPIPMDWEVKNIGQCGEVITGSTPPRGISELWGGSFNWISAKDFRGKYIISSDEKITEAGKRYCRVLHRNSVLVTCIASIGLNAIAKRSCATNQQINAVVCRDCDYEYFYYQCCFNESRLRQMAGQTAVPIIGKSQFEAFHIALPKEIKEQRRIAGALSDVDELISALGKLIEKKRNIKTGAMQQLLTGKTRLPGFSVKSPRSLRPLRDEDSPAANAEVAEYKMTELGPIPKDWEVKRLGEIVNIMDNPRVPLSESQRKSGIFPYCGANGIVDFIDRYEFDEEAILIAEDGGNFSDFATRPIAYKMSGKYWVNNHAHVLTAKVGCELDYLLFHLAHKDITDIISGGTRAKLTRGQLENIIISLPTLAEQKAIAAVLSDIDAEIAALEADRAKYERIKTGMMQELLTGKTRLKP